MHNAKINGEKILILLSVKQQYKFSPGARAAKRKNTGLWLVVPENLGLCCCRIGQEEVVVVYTYKKKGKASFRKTKAETRRHSLSRGIGHRLLYRNT